MSGVCGGCGRFLGGVMTKIVATEGAVEAIRRVRAVRRGPLTFSIDGGCCEGTAPHLYEHYVVPPGVEPVAEVDGVPVYLSAGMDEVYADAVVTIDVVEQEASDAMSAETVFGLRFVLREGCP